MVGGPDMAKASAYTAISVSWSMVPPKPDSPRARTRTKEGYDNAWEASMSLRHSSFMLSCVGSRRYTTERNGVGESGTGERPGHTKT